MRYFYNFKTRHPEKKHMNVMDYGLASIMMPTTLAGSQIGGYVLLMFPALYINAALTILLLYLSYVAIKKALQLDKKEKAERAAREQAESGAPQVETKDPTAQKLLGVPSSSG